MALITSVKLNCFNSAKYFCIDSISEKRLIWQWKIILHWWISEKKNYWFNQWKFDWFRFRELGQCRRLHWSSAGPPTVPFVDCLNLPIISRNLAQYRPYTKPIVIFTMASNSESRRARVRSMDGTLLNHVSLLPRQTILKVRNPEAGTALARCCAENMCWRPEFGPELAAMCISELSFQQRHNIGNRSSARFLPMLGQCWAVSNFAFGYFASVKFNHKITITRVK